MPLLLHRTKPWQAVRAAFAQRPWSLLLLLTGGVGALAWGLSSWTQKDATFSVNARTQVLVLEVGCTQQVVWDLPAGRAAGAGAADATTATAGQVISVVLRGGARARLLWGPDGHWRASFETPAENVFGCGEPLPSDTVALSVDGATLPTDAQGYFYESSARAAEAPLAPLLLRGRVLLGEEVQFGSGTGRGAAMLGTARIEARTHDDQTRQRRLIHEEQVDPGGLIDTHGCLERTGDEAALRACVRGLQTAGQLAEGFVHLSGDDDGPRGFDVQLLVTGQHVGVRQQAGAERRIVVTAWSRAIGSTWVQISVVLLAGLTVLAELLSLADRLRGQGDVPEPRPPARPRDTNQETLP